MATLLEHTVMPSGGDFTSLSAALDHIEANHPNLVTSDVYAEVKIDGDWSGGADTNNVDFRNVVTDESHYVDTYTTAAARHSGIWTTSKYRMSLSSSVFLWIKYVRFTGIQVSEAVSSVIIYPYDEGITGGQAWISHCIVKGDGLSTGQIGLYAGHNNTYVWDTLVYGIETTNSSSRGIQIQSPGCKLYSVTSIGGYYGILGNESAIGKNCYSGNAGSGGCYVGIITKTTCASSDTTGSPGLQNIPVSTANFVNVTPGSENFHLVSGSALKDVGTDTSGDAAPMNFTTDIDGGTRSGTWDIGADEYSAGGGSYDESIILSSTPVLGRAAVADLLGGVTMLSTPGASMIGGMDLFNAITLLSGPAVVVGYGLNMFPSLILASNPALAASALADFYNSLTFASTPAAVMAAVADLIAGLALASDPALAALGGSDFYESLALSSSPALAAAVFKEAFGELTLASNPALAAAALADLIAEILVASSPALLAAAGFDINEAITLLSNALLTAASALTSGPVTSIGSKRATAGLSNRAPAGLGRAAGAGLRRDA